jgi:hypothetical protein
MLFRGVGSPGAEAIALLWDGAPHLFRRDPGTYGVTGLERIPLGAPTPLARMYSDAARALGMTRTPLFQRRQAGQISVSVALLSPPALILAGDVRQESQQLRFHMGAMLAAALPQHALLFGIDEVQSRNVLQALALAFGSPQANGGDVTPVAANLAGVLWESIPTRSQRRLRELCDDASALDYLSVMNGARLVLRRAGLFVCGDIAVALREVLNEEGLGAEPPQNFEELASIATQRPSVADLLRLATSAEYAEIRWQQQRSMRNPGSGP